MRWRLHDWDRLLIGNKQFFDQRVTKPKNQQISLKIESEMEHEENVTHKLNMINEREWISAASVDDVKQLYNINNGWGYGDSWRAKKRPNTWTI